MSHGRGWPSCAVDRVLARRRARRMLEHTSDSELEHIVGLGSVILGRLKADVDLGTFGAFRLYSGLSESGELLIYCRGESDVNSCFYLTEEVELIYQTSEMSDEGPVVQRLELNSPEDFLRLDPKSVEEFYEDLMNEGFWDRVAFRHSHVGKPGYDNVWMEKL